MEIIETKVYYFEELDDSAKDRAREWYKQGLDYPWWHDAKASIDAFCKEFGVKVKDYSVGAFAPSFIDTTAETHHFRGLKLKQYDATQMPTGYYLDCTLWTTFVDVWQKTGSALKAFNEAIDEALKDIVRDWEYQYSDESVDEVLIINGYTFTEDGKRF